ncbi:unnamed protein product [Cylicostephanus goldi]|uniref:Uncharacterized protein n=1 Tax=Cylicostephanus goldi TaxID=71465 RepID=A0A3P7N532_CYLGO|nr:unnamed protein product [Cylicostephanus goldi]
MEDAMEVDADIENQHDRCLVRKRHKNGDLNGAVKVRKVSLNQAAGDSAPSRAYTEVAGRIAEVELENFMCHGHLKVDFETSENNCFYIGGPNGSESKLIIAVTNKARIRLVLTNSGLGSHPDYGDFVVVERVITPSASTYSLKSISGFGRNRRGELILS